MSIDINKHETDIDNLKRQNVNDLISIKQLYIKQEEIEEKLTQIKYIDNTLVKKLKKEYEKLQKIILDENVQVELNNKIEETKNVQVELNNKIEETKTELNEVSSQMDKKAKQVDLETTNNRIDNLIIHSGETAEKDVELIDCRVGQDGKIYTTSGEAIRKQFSSLKDYISEIENIFFEKVNKKVPYNFTNIKAFIRYDNGNITETADGNSTDFVTLSDDDTWLASGRCQYSSCLIATYDSNKTFLRSYGRTDGSLVDYIDYEFKPKQDEKYAKFGSIYATLTLAKKQTVKVDKDLSYNPLKGKTLYSDGDSITFGAKGTSYIKQIADNEEMILTNGAVSGTSLAIRDGRTDSICERIKALTGTYNYIVVSGGTNDAFASIPLGTMVSDNNQQYLATFNTKTTLGALEEICRTLIYNFPESKKLFILTHKLLNGNGTTWSNSFQDKYWDGIIKVLDKWGIPYIDMRKIPFASFNSNYLSKYFGEDESMGTHPNTLGYKEFYVNPITSKMKSL